MSLSTYEKNAVKPLLFCYNLIKMFQYLPSKNFAISAGAVLIGLAFFLVASYIKKDRHDPTNSIVANPISSIQKNTDVDTDNDGLKDWGEALWGTDAKNPDTDGDGTQDGQEVTERRNPIAKGPKDILSASDLVSKNLNKSSSDSLTKTDFLSQQFFAQVVTLKNQGKLNSQSMNELSQSFTTQLLQEAPEDTYVPADIRIQNDNSEASLKAYGNSLGALIKKYSRPDEENEITIINRALSTQDPLEMRKLIPIIDLYIQGGRDLLILRVPSHVAKNHMGILNSVVGMGNALVKIQSLFDDPLTGITAFGQYRQEASRLGSEIKILRDYFAENGVFFSNRDAGYILFRVY